MKKRNAFTLAEVLIGFFLTCIICVILYEMLISGSKGMTRAEHKLDYMQESTIVFLYLKRDLHATVKIESLDESPSGVQLTLTRLIYDTDPDATQKIPEQRIIWDLTTVNGKHCIRRKRVNGPGSDRPPQYFCRGTVKEFSIQRKQVPENASLDKSLDGLRISIVFDSHADATTTSFHRTFFMHSISRANSWIALPR